MTQISPDEMVDILRPFFVELNSAIGLAGLNRIIAETTNKTITTADILVGGRLTVTMDATGGARSVFLPAIASAYNAGLLAGMEIAVVKTDVSANAVTVDGDGGETINGLTTQSLAAQYNYIVVQAGASEWHIIGSG
jgi:hypothetical protein